MRSLFTLPEQYEVLGGACLTLTAGYCRGRANLANIRRLPPYRCAIFLSLDLRFAAAGRHRVRSSQVGATLVDPIELGRVQRRLEMAMAPLRQSIALVRPARPVGSPAMGE